MPDIQDYSERPEIDATYQLPDQNGRCKSCRSGLHSKDYRDQVLT